MLNYQTVYIIYPSRCLKPPILLHPQRLSAEQAAGLPHNEIAAQVGLEPLECRFEPQYYSNVPCFVRIRYCWNIYYIYLYYKHTRTINSELHIGYIGIYIYNYIYVVFFQPDHHVHEARCVDKHPWCRARMWEAKGSLWGAEYRTAWQVEQCRSWTWHAGFE